ncbi:MAG: triose-phosphate isomerase [Bacteroidota bacterium]
MRKQIVAGNWKMNKSFEEAEDLILEISEALDKHPPEIAHVVICPPYPYLELATDIGIESHFSVGAQNVYPADSGAFTGEISAAMLSEIGVEYCIIGHSERRKYFHEDNEFLYEKVKAVISHAISPIFCCGEILAEREQGAQQQVVEKQLNETIFKLDEEDFRQVVIAYEPVWAIGTGLNATPQQAQEMHSFIRSLIHQKYGEELALTTSILYGGSCNAVNAIELFEQPDVDGGLIGGASLKANDFLGIIRSL